jgi:hypothetical protein
MFTHRLDDTNNVWVTKEDQATVAVVIGKRTKRFRPDRDLRVQLARGLKRDCHDKVGCLVDAAHAVDGNLLDEKLLCDKGIFSRIGVLHMD